MNGGFSLSFFFSPEITNSIVHILKFGFYLSIEWFIPLDLCFHSIFFFFLCFYRGLTITCNYVVVERLICLLIFMLVIQTIELVQLNK